MSNQGNSFNEDTLYLNPNEKVKLFNPLDQRTKEDHAARLKRWTDLGLLYPNLMDTLVAMSPEEIESLIIILSKPIAEVQDILNKFMFIKGIANDEIDISFDEEDDLDENHDESEDGDWEE